MEELFDFPDADIILRSSNSRDFRVLKLFITKSSPVLDRLIKTASDSAVSGLAASTIPLPVIYMSESGAILYSLLTFVLPMPSVLPPSVEETLELLSVAQKYEMNHVMAHIRGSVSLQDPPLISRSNALHVYSLAQKYGLRQEVVQTARLTVRSTLTVENLEDKLDVMPGDHLHELWKYHQRLQGKLLSNINEFRLSSAYSALNGLNCVVLTQSKIPRWIDDYICFMASTPSSLNLFEFQSALARHVSGKDTRTPGKQCPFCLWLPEKAIDKFWMALTAFVEANMKEVTNAHVSMSYSEFKLLQAESAFSISERNISSEDHIGFVAVPLPLPESLDVRNADIVLQSSDSANFRVHKAVLASSSQFFRDMFSLPQPPNDEAIDGLPFVRLSEDAELVRALITVMYPIHTEIPTSYDRVLALLAAAQKYDMSAVQSSIRAEIVRRDLPAPTGAQSFRAFAIAFTNNLTPEMGATARLTLDYPLTFEMLGDELRLFSGSALRELAGFRKTCRDNMISCLETFLDAHRGPSNIWLGCTRPRPQLLLPFTVSPSNDKDKQTLPFWLREVFTQQIEESKKYFTHGIIKPLSIREKYLTALGRHSPTLNDCPTCLMVHAHKGEKYCAGLEQKLTHARNQASDLFSCKDLSVFERERSIGTGFRLSEELIQVPFPRTADREMLSLKRKTESQDIAFSIGVHSIV
jgi:hypothetical protein